MTEQTSSRRPAHLTLVELLIGVLLLAVAAFFVVRNMQQAKERAQRQQFIEALNVWETFVGDERRRTKAAEPFFALVKANPQLHDAQSSRGFTPLHLAAYHGNHDIVQWLLDHSANVNAKTNDDWTPLHWAAHYNRKEVAELLLANGADVSAKDNLGGTPLLWAAFNGNKELAELLLAKGADVNAKDNFGATPLHFASRFGRKAIAELLLAKGADIHAKDNGGRTPLDLLDTHKHKALADLLRKHGAKDEEAAPVAPAAEK